jgi:hypothetical protein
LVQLLGWIRSEEEKRRVAEMSKDSELQSLRMSLGIMRGEMERMGREGGEIRKMREELEAARQEREAGIRGDGARAGVWQGQISVLQGRCDMYRRELVRRGGDEIGVEVVWAKGTLWMGKVSKWITVHELIGRVNSELEVPVWVVRLICRGKGLVGEGVLVDLGAVEKWSVYGETVARP